MHAHRVEKGGGELMMEPSYMVVSTQFSGERAAKPLRRLSTKVPARATSVLRDCG